MTQKLSVRKQFGREQIAGMVIIGCLGILLITVLAIHFMDVRVINVEQVDTNLYTIITDRGPVNVTPSEILRIERTYPKTALTGHPMEVDKIYTDKGFIYVSSQDPFAATARKLINQVDFEGKSVWERSMDSLAKVQPYAYAVGTPESWIPWVFFTIALQSWVMSVGGITLAILIFPLRWPEKIPTPGQVSVPGEPEFRSASKEDKQLSVIAK